MGKSLKSEQQAAEENDLYKKEQQAKTAILNFLTELSIAKIVYVDDRCSMNELKLSFTGKLKAHYDAKPEQLDFVDWTLPEAAFEKSINEVWDGKNEDEKRELFLKVLQHENDQDELENSTAPLKLKNLLADKIELYSPSEWIQSKQGIIQSLNENAKILFLFDIDFKHAPLADGRDGRDLAMELLQDNTINSFLYCGIFSHLFTINEEDTKRNEYCNTHKLQKERFYTISKKRFNKDSYLPGLAEGIRNTLLINEIEYLKKETTKALRSSYTQTIKEVSGLTPESFNHIIQKSSKEEGVWEIATLIRLSNLISTNKALKLFVPDVRRKRINQGLEKIRKVETIKTGGDTPIDKEQVKQLRAKELYIEEEILNKLHYPLSNGDIFYIDDKKYILLVQPCNVALRSNGKRNRNYDVGFLLQIEEITMEVFKQYSKEQYLAQEIIEDVFLGDDKIKIIKFSSFKPVSLSPLDLTVFDNFGTAKLNLTEKENQSNIIQESWKKRYKELCKTFLSYANSIKTFRTLKTENKNLLKNSIYIGSLFNGFGINNENCLSRNGNLLIFNIKRIAHYRSPYSDFLLQKFMQYLSRNAFEHDFSH